MSLFPALDLDGVAPAVLDWYGLAVYLADSVEADDLDLDIAQQALGAADGPDDLESLRSAIAVAANRLGDDAVPTAMLRAALEASAVTRVA